MSRGRKVAVAVAWKFGSVKLKILPKPRLFVQIRGHDGLDHVPIARGQRAGEAPLELLGRRVVGILSDVQGEIAKPAANCP